MTSEPELLEELAKVGSSEMSLDEKRALAVLHRRLFSRPDSALLELGRYRLRERLGSGGTGIVYRAFDPVLRRDVAIKVVRRQAEGAGVGAEIAARLKREGQALASLAHPNIVQIYGVATDDQEGVVYMVMELVAGPTLRRWLATETRTVAEIAEKFRLAGAALAAAHHRGVLHRDFKADNVIVDEHEQPRVVDFGGLGTPLYMSPEQAAGRPLDARSDTYSFCAAFLEALEGRGASARLLRELRRGTQPDPTLRPWSMDALLASIQPSRRGRWALVGIGTVAAVAGVLAVQSTDPQPCGFGADLPSLELRGEEPRRTLAAFQRNWRVAHELLCTPPIAPTRDQVRCLAEVRSKWTGIRGALERHPTHAETGIVLDGLPVPLACESGESTDDRGGPLVARYEAQVAEVAALQVLQPWPEVREQQIQKMEEIRVAASVSGDAAVDAGAGMYLGLMAIWDMRHDDAALLFEDAHAMALRAGRPSIALECARYRVQVSKMLGLGSDDEGKWIAAAYSDAKASGESLGLARVLMLEARLELDSMHLPRAIELCDAAAALLDAESDPGTWSELLQQRGMALSHLDRDEEAVADFRRGLDIARNAARPDASDSPSLLNGLGVALRKLGRFEEAVAALEEALAITEKIQPGSPDLAAMRGNLAQIYADQGRTEEALAQFQKVREVFEAFAGPRHPYALQTGAVIAELHWKSEAWADARREAETVLRWELAGAYGVRARVILADVAARDGDADIAREQANLVIADPSSPPDDQAEAQAILDRLDAASSTATP